MTTEADYSRGHIILPYTDDLNLEEQQVSDSDTLPSIQPPSFPPPPPPAPHNLSMAPIYSPMARQPDVSACRPPSSHNPHYATPAVLYHAGVESESFLHVRPPSPTSPSASSRYPDFNLNQRLSGNYPQPFTYLGHKPPENNRPSRDEVAEAAVARPLAIVGLFCCCQLWLSIPAILLANRRRRRRSTYKCSIFLSLVAIVVGICISMAFGTYVLIMLNLDTVHSVLGQISNTNSTSQGHSSV